MSPQEEIEHWRRIAGQGVQTEHALRVKIAKAAAFLDGLAERLKVNTEDGVIRFRVFDEAAAECRAMARKLRGEA